MLLFCIELLTIYWLIALAENSPAQSGVFYWPSGQTSYASLYTLNIIISSSCTVVGGIMQSVYYDALKKPHCCKYCNAFLGYVRAHVEQVHTCSQRIPAYAGTAGYGVF